VLEGRSIIERSRFGGACNSHNRVTVAAGASIEFLKPAHLGDVLTCEGVEQVLQGRHGVYDMKVTNQRGETVAMFRGKSATIHLLTQPKTPYAFLTGSSAAKAFGAFSYRWYDDGTIQPDAAWVRANIVTTYVPIGSAVMV